MLTARGHIFKEHFKNNIPPHLHQYFNYIYTEIGTPPNLEIAQDLSDTLKIKIIIKHYPNEPIIQKLDYNIPIQSLDQARLQFVIKNLIYNALKHRKQPTDNISITTYQTALLL